MDELLKESVNNFNLVGSLSVLQLIIALTLSFFLVVIIAKVYMMTHSGYSYSKSFVQTIVFVGITITLIMIIVGSNIARAFALVGAMSIIRFRNPIKDSKDLAFIFMAMAVGMACGTYFYLFATIFTFFVVAIVSLFHIFTFGEKGHNSYVLRINLSKTGKEAIKSIFDKYSSRCAIISIDQFSSDNKVEEIIYEIDLKRKFNYDDVISELNDSEHVHSINLLVGESSISV